MEARKPTMPKKTFHHVGLRAFEPQPDEDYVAPSDCWVTNPKKSLHQIEFLRYGENSPISEEFRNAPHIAYAVDNLDEHIAGKEIYVEPFDVGYDPPFARVVFTKEDGLFVEYMQFYPGRTWFTEEE